MTDKIQKARRAAFEAALSLKNSQRAKSGFDDLRPEEVRNMWWAFNAALDCVVIELQADRGLVAYDDFVTVRDSCRDAIESTNLGIKVK